MLSLSSLDGIFFTSCLWVRATYDHHTFLHLSNQGRTDNYWGPGQ
ncbi:unnamed protein product [Staurois parvus]|uniref:Uncharacterized protein n=1 Tax=Staurois parvus TaxID=386267 RepID=A0ABN9FX53_9NEOB|nr:unnamed protein product [Staurois parvus]